MKLPFKLIAILVIVSLLGIFAYQTYWLTGLYRTMKADLEQSLLESMRISDYNEMMIRVEKLRTIYKGRGEVSVSAGYSSDNKESFVRSTATVDSNEDSVKNTLVDTTNTVKPAAGLHLKDGLDMILNGQRSILELATYFQRGLHSGLDILMNPDVAVYDSLLHALLKSKLLDVSYRLEHLQAGATVDSSYVYLDTIAVCGTPGYVPGPEARQYAYAFDFNTNQSYRLTIETVDRIVLKQMSGILVTSFIILIILGGSFWVLIRTILRQKTLEEMKSDFTNNITHELKTPIAVAYAANDALLNFNQAEEKVKRDRYLRICQEQLQQLSGLVEQILSTSMERRKTFRLHSEALSLKQMLVPLIEQHKLKTDSPIQITLTIEPDDLAVRADRSHFGNILSNLIDNAIKYSPGKAEIHIHCRQTSGEATSQVEISVTDRGIGISEEKQKLVFDKFYRVPAGNLYNTKGYGLGLFYVKMMVEQHGGTVSVKSELGKGSTLKIVI